MIFELPDHIRLAIRLRALKAGVTTGEIVEELIENHYPGDVAEAKASLSQEQKDKP